jgi:putative transposase
MPAKKAEGVEVSQREEKQLKQIVRQQNNPQWLVKRATIILRAAEGKSNSQIAREMDITRNTVRVWQKRWQAAKIRRGEVEQAGEEKAQCQLIEDTLADAPRSGAPPTYSAEQVVQIIAVSCEDPALSGREVSHWTPRELADEAIKRGIVERISPRQVGRFLKRGRPETASDTLLAE